MKQIFLFFVLSVLESSFLFGWDGYDNNSGEYVEINKGNLVRQYQDIDVYHYEDGDYHNEEVQGIYGSELETYDNDTGEFHNYEMN